MQINPTLSMYLNIVALVLSVFAAASWWDGAFDAHTAALITGIMNSCVAALNIVLHAYSAPKGGPLAD